MFSGDAHNDWTFTICLQLNVNCSAHLPLSADCWLCCTLMSDESKPVNIYMLHYQAAWLGPCMHTLRHIFIYWRARTHTHRHGATRPWSCSLKWADGWLTEWIGPWKHFASRIPNGTLLAHWPRRKTRINMWDEKWENETGTCGRACLCHLH